MAINMDKMKQKLESLQGNGNKKSAFWRPQDGEQVIRIVPTEDGDPFKEYWFHYNLGNNPGFLSPKKNFGEECPLDNYVRDLYRQGDEESIKMAKSLSARQRFFSPVVVRGEEEEGRSSGLELPSALVVHGVGRDAAQAHSYLRGGADQPGQQSAAVRHSVTALRL